MKKNFWDFTPEDVVKRAVDCLTEKDLKEVKDSKGSIKKKGLTRFEIDEKYKNYKYPISLSAWDSYKKTISKNAKTGISSMNLESLYKICTYTDVSADYMLGFIDTKRKEQLAEMVRKEFGLSDEAMDTLSKAVTHSILPLPSKYKNFSESDFISFLIVNFAVRFEQAIIQYFYAEDELNTYNEQYIDNGRTVKDKYMHEEAKITDDCQQLQQAVYSQKYILTQLVDEFLNDLVTELTPKETDETAILI